MRLARGCAAFLACSLLIMTAHAQVSAEPVAPSPPPAGAQSGPGVSAGPWILFGTAALLAGATGLLFGFMQADLETVEGASKVPWSEIREPFDRVPELSVAGTVTALSAAFALGLAIIIYVVEDSRAGQVALGPGWIEWQGTF